MLGVSLSAICSALVWPCAAAAPIKIAGVAPVSELVTEAEAKVKLLDEALASDKTYLEKKATTIPVDAGVLAVLAQAIAESEEKPSWKASAADLREAAKAVAASKGYEEAKLGLEAVKAALEGKASGAAVEHDWNKLAKLGSVMKEVNRRTGKVRSATRKLPANPEEVARDASVLAVLALVAHDDTHEVKKKEEIGDWQKQAKEFSAQFTAAAAALRKGDKTGASDAFKKGNAACNACHKQFREE
jgi:cytochrome c556